MFVFGASSPGVRLRKVEEYERRGEEVLELFALTDAELRVRLRSRAGVPHKWATEEQSHILEQEQWNPDTEQEDTDGNE